MVEEHAAATRTTTSTAVGGGIGLHQVMEEVIMGAISHLGP